MKILNITLKYVERGIKEHMYFSTYAENISG